MTNLKNNHHVAAPLKSNFTLNNYKYPVQASYENNNNNNDEDQKGNHAQSQNVVVATSRPHQDYSSSNIALDFTTGNLDRLHDEVDVSEAFSPQRSFLARADLNNSSAPSPSSKLSPSQQPVIDPVTGVASSSSSSSSSGHAMASTMQIEALVHTLTRYFDAVKLCYATNISVAQMISAIFDADDSSSVNAEVAGRFLRFSRETGTRVIDDAQRQKEATAKQLVTLVAQLTEHERESGGAGGGGDANCAAGTRDGERIKVLQRKVHLRCSLVQLTCKI